MKRIILLSLIALVSITACKKKKKETIKKTVSQIVIDRGTWLTVNETIQYYDVNNNVLSTETVQSGPTYHFSRTSDTVRLTENGKNTLKRYHFSHTNNKEYVSITNSDGNDLKLFEVLSADPKIMQWQKIENNITFTLNGQQQTAAKKVTTINFHCPCQD